MTLCKYCFLIALYTFDLNKVLQCLIKCYCLLKRCVIENVKVFFDLTVSFEKGANTSFSLLLALFLFENTSGILSIVRLLFHSFLGLLVEKCSMLRARSILYLRSIFISACQRISGPLEIHTL